MPVSYFEWRKSMILNSMGHNQTVIKLGSKSLEHIPVYCWLDCHLFRTAHVTCSLVPNTLNTCCYLKCFPQWGTNTNSVPCSAYQWNTVYSLICWKKILWWDRKTSMRSMFDSLAFVGIDIGDDSDEMPFIHECIWSRIPTLAVVCR